MKKRAGIHSIILAMAFFIGEVLVANLAPTAVHAGVGIRISPRSAKPAKKAGSDRSLVVFLNPVTQEAGNSVVGKKPLFSDALWKGSKKRFSR